MFNFLSVAGRWEGGCWKEEKRESREEERRGEGVSEEGRKEELRGVVSKRRANE